MAGPDRIDLNYDREYSKSLFNKGEDKEWSHRTCYERAYDTIVVFGDSNYRFDIPKFKIITVQKKRLVSKFYCLFYT